MTNSGLYLASAFIVAFHAILIIRAVDKKIDESVATIIAKVESVQPAHANGVGISADQKADGNEKLELGDIGGALGTVRNGSRTADGKLAEGFEHIVGGGEQEGAQVCATASALDKVGNGRKALAEEKSESNARATANNFANHKADNNQTEREGK